MIRFVPALRNPTLSESSVLSLRARNEADLYDLMMALLSLLFAIKNSTWVAHWNAKGKNSYSDHLLLQRIYEKMDKPIDRLGEHIVGFTGKAVRYDLVVQELTHTGKTDTLAKVEELIKRAARTSDNIREILSESKQSFSASTSGLDNYLCDLNDKLDRFGYLIRQRIGGGE
jgi:DNA-binding ferritin-like protein